MDSKGGRQMSGIAGGYGKIRSGTGGRKAKWWGRKNRTGQESEGKEEG